MPASHLLERGLPVVMRDGTTLIADIYRPQGESPCPVLLQRLPYDRSLSFMTQSIVSLEVTRALDAGFAVMLQDCRGRFDSDGEFAPFIHEADDGVDTIAWLRQQEWCNGRVGMWGASYIGATQVLAATRAPEGLLAVAPQLTADQYYDGWTYEGGAFQLGFVLLWILESLAAPDIEREADPSRRESRWELLKSLQTDPARLFAQLPVDSDNVADLAPYVREWLRHSTPDAYWRSIDPSRRPHSVNTAGLHIAGWHDIFLNGGLRTYRAWRDSASTEWARLNQFLVVGPWSHGNVSDWQGDDWLGYGAAAAGLDLNAVHLEFFQAILSDKPANIPRVRYFVGGSNEWRASDEWPPPGRDRPYYLASGGTAAEKSDGRLTRSPADDAVDSWVSRPLDPVPTVGGASFLPGLLIARNSGPKDQSSVEARSDVAVYTSDPLDADVEIAGEVRAELFAASSAADCDWVVRLVDVRPDGSTRSVTDGILRAKYRDGVEEGTPLTPGSVYPFRITVGSTAHRFLKGHRVRIQVCSSNFPRFDRNPQQFMHVSSAVEADFVDAEQRLMSGSSYPSRLILPVVKGILR